MAVDYSTRFCVAQAIRRPTAKSIVAFFRKLIFPAFGLPTRLVSDHNSQQASKFFRAFCAENNIVHRMTTAYHPQVDGLAERTIDTLKTMLRIKCLDAPTQDTWPDYISDCVFHHNSSRQASLHDSPFQLMHSFSPRLPVHAELGTPPVVPSLPPTPGAVNPALAPAHAHLHQAQVRQAFHHNKGRRFAQFAPGDLVLVRDLAPTPGLSKKLSTQFNGPFEILGQQSAVNYEIKLADHGARRTSVVHVGNMKRYLPRRPVHLLSTATTMPLPMPAVKPHAKSARSNHCRALRRRRAYWAASDSASAPPPAAAVPASPSVASARLPVSRTMALSTALHRPPAVSPQPTTPPSPQDLSVRVAGFLALPQAMPLPPCPLISLPAMPGPLLQSPLLLVSTWSPRAATILPVSIESAHRRRRSAAAHHPRLATRPPVCLPRPLMSIKLPDVFLSRVSICQRLGLNLDAVFGL